MSLCELFIYRKNITNHKMFCYRNIDPQTKYNIDFEYVKLIPITNTGFPLTGSIGPVGLKRPTSSVLVAVGNQQSLTST